jgi:hypothetical protein
MASKRARTTSATTQPRPAATRVPAAAATPDDIKALFTWKYYLTPERFIVCRHLRLEGMLMEGLIPMPGEASDDQAPPARGSQEARDAAVASSRRYALAVAVEPRIVEDQAEATATGAIWIGDLPLPVQVDLMNTGMAHVVTFDPRAVGLTDPTFPPDAAAAGRDGAAVRDEAQLLRD